jgi:uncharacterized membrane-anchored protein YhcB (DUF1043 family)
MNTIIFASIASLIAGIIIGVVIVRRFDPQSTKNRDLERRLQLAEQNLANYQDQVTQHFSTTAELVNSLTSSYRNVHEYLASSAMQLSNLDISRQILTGQTAANTSNDSTTETEELIEPPKDYAPKTDDGVSTLSEEYGLKDDDDDDTQTTASA